MAKLALLRVVPLLAVVLLIVVAAAAMSVSAWKHPSSFVHRHSKTVVAVSDDVPTFVGGGEEEGASLKAPSASCPNDCSGAGTCVANQCQCNAGFLNTDCSIASTMYQPACVSSSTDSATFCIIYKYVKDTIYARAQVTPSAGWGAFLFGTKTGMDNGTGLVFSWSNGAPLVQDIQSLKYATPTILTVSSVPPASIVGFVNATTDTIDIQFQRAANTGIPGLYVLPTVSGVNTSTSLAVGTTYFKHHVGAQCTLTDLVALSNGQNIASASCPSPP